MNKVAIAVHGGAGAKSPFLRKNTKQIENGLNDAIQKGHRILKKGGSALDAVVEAIKVLEDNPLFNAGAGSALNSDGEVEMDASIMNGKNLKAGAVSMVREVKNPILLARLVMEKTRHVFLSGYGAQLLAKDFGLAFEKNDYFLTEHQYQEFKKLNERETKKEILNKRMEGTVGAVALDKKGNIAAGTSTGGTSNCLPGRIGDSCIIGAGCYANNETCAVSGTGEGEYLIRGVVGHTISSMVEGSMGLQEACEHVIFNGKPQGEMGVISINCRGEIAAAFNTRIMKRAWIDPLGNIVIKIE